MFVVLLVSIAFLLIVQVLSDDSDVVGGGGVDGDIGLGVGSFGGVGGAGVDGVAVLVLVLMVVILVGVVVIGSGGDNRRRVSRKPLCAAPFVFFPCAVGVAYVLHRQVFSTTTSTASLTTTSIRTIAIITIMLFPLALLCAAP